MSADAKHVSDDKPASVVAALRLTLAASRPRRATGSPRMTMPALRPRRATKPPEKGALK